MDHRTKKEKTIKNSRRADLQPSEPAKTRSLPKMNNLQPIVEPNFGMTVTPVFQCSGNAEHVHVTVATEEALFSTERVLKPIGDLYQPGTEWREMAETISRVKPCAYNFLES